MSNTNPTQSATPSPHLLVRLEAQGKNRVFKSGCAYLKGSNSNLNKAILAVKGQGTLVVWVHAEKKAPGVLFSGAGDCQIHHAPPGTTAMKLGEEVDAPEFKVALLSQPGREIRSGEHGVADRCGTGRYLGEPCTRLGLLEIRCIGCGNVVLLAVGEERIARNQSRKGFKESGRADDRQSGSIGRGAFTQCNSH